MSNEPYPQLPIHPDISPTAPTIEAAPAKHRWIKYGGNFLLGLGLLLLGIPIAWLIGIGAARLMPASSQRMPLQENLLRRTNRVMTEIRRLPGHWQPAPPPETRIEPVPIPTQPLPPLTPAPAALNSRDRKIAEEELAALQQEFETIRKRVFDLESKLGQAQSTENVESRLASLAEQLISDQQQPIVLPAAPQSPAAPVKPQGDITPLILETAELKITLPSDALFAPGEARLLATAPDLLSTVFEDLSQYPGATLLIGSHTDNDVEPSESLELAFQQANALRAYLSGHFPDHRWVTIGYGQSQPLTDNSTPTLRQRNRRVEIAIDRR
ncbi:MAG: OmpA family protein [Leptolyngbyaceae cyanobacterium]